ncbi:MAG: divalent-cation tolerance protein CutA [Rhodospirillales bacterium]|nr:divalent-cation tolerance protein CutA [Rhodospirillales bacterium]
MSTVLVYVTVPTREEAIAIARSLVEARLAASANVLPTATSFYWWQGKLEERSEALLFLKTRPDLVERVVAAVKTVHSYACPCVLALPISDGNPDYFEWIAKETKQ